MKTRTVRAMICVKASSIFSFTTRNFFTPSKSHLLLHQSSSSSLSFITKPKSSTTFASKMSATKSETIEHIVLFKVREETDQSKINSMINGLNGLISLDQVLHLTAGPIFKTQSSFNFTHLLHTRYRSKDDLSAYSAHPDHVSVVKESVLPICEDIMAVDWVASDLDENLVVLKSGSAMRVKFLKLKEGGDKGEVLGVFGGVKNGLIEQSSFGENFSPARANGFSIASIEVFRGLGELEEFDLNEKQKEKFEDLVDGVIVVDYVVPPPQSANL